MGIIPENSVKTQKYAQVLNMPKKVKKELFTNKVWSLFVMSLITSITDTSYSRLTEYSRIIKQDK